MVLFKIHVVYDLKLSPLGAYVTPIL